MAKGAGSSRKKKSPAAARSPAGGEPSPRATDLTRVHIWQVQAVRDVLVVAACVGIVWLGYMLRAVTVPLLVALLLAYLFEPVIERLCRRWKLSRARAVGLLLLIVIASLVLVLSLVIPLVVGQGIEMARHVRDGTMRSRVAAMEEFVPERFETEFRAILDVLPAGRGDGTRGDGNGSPAGESGAEQPQGGAVGAEGSDEDQSVGEVAAAMTEELVREIVASEIERSRAPPVAEGDAAPDWIDLASNSADAVLRIVGRIVGLGLLTFLIPFYFFFFSLWYPAVVRFGRGLLPERNKRRTLELLAKMDAVVSGFVRGRIVISLIMGAMLAVGWMICGVPYAVLLGFVIGIFCAVPYLGGVGVPIAAGMLLLKEAAVGGHESDWWWIWPLLWPTLVFAIVQLVEGYLLTPAIAGKATNLDPVTIIVAVLAGGSVLGVYGMLLAIPVAACLKILFTDVVLPKIRDWAEGRAEDPLPIERE